MIKLFSALCELIFVILSKVIGGLFDLIPELFISERKPEYNAKFISASKVLEKYGAGFSVNGKYCLADESFRHMLICGNSGSGKTTCIIIPSILLIAQQNASIISFDPSKEIRYSTSGASKDKFGCEVLILDFSDKESICYNPLKRVKTVSDIKQLSEILIKSAYNNSGEAFWNKSAEDIITLLIRFLVFHAPSKYHNFFNVLHLLNQFSNTEKFDLMMAKTRDEELLNEYKSFISMSDRTLTGIISTAKTALSIFGDDTISSITSGDDQIDFESFRTKKKILYLNSSIPMMNYASVLSSIFFHQFFNHILNQAPNLKDQNPIYFCLDEVASLTIPLSLVLNYGRKYNIACLCVLQELEQLDFKYGKHEAQNIITNSYTKVFLPGQSHKTSIALSESLGKYEYIDESNGSTKLRPLLTSDEIRLSDRALIFVGQNAPMHQKLYPYYKNKKFKALMEVPPIEPDNELPFEKPPLINLSDE